MYENKIIKHNISSYDMLYVISSSIVCMDVEMHQIIVFTVRELYNNRTLVHVK